MDWLYSDQMMSLGLLGTCLRKAGHLYSMARINSAASFRGEEGLQHQIQIQAAQLRRY